MWEFFPLSLLVSRTVRLVSVVCLSGLVTFMTPEGVCGRRTGVGVRDGVLERRRGGEGGEGGGVEGRGDEGEGVGGEWGRDRGEGRGYSGGGCGHVLAEILLVFQPNLRRNKMRIISVKYAQYTYVLPNSR